MQYWGFDLGDGESTLARVSSEGKSYPEIVEVEGNKVIITVWAIMRDGEVRIGDNAARSAAAAVRSAAERGIKLVPVVASNAERDTELFGRALAICTGGTYVFLTDDSGVGNDHLEPIIGDYTVESLHNVIVRIINENR